MQMTSGNASLFTGVLCCTRLFRHTALRRLRVRHKPYEQPAQRRASAARSQEEGAMRHAARPAFFSQSMFSS